MEQQKKHHSLDDDTTSWSTKHYLVQDCYTHHFSQINPTWNYFKKTASRPLEFTTIEKAEALLDKMRNHFPSRKFRIVAKTTTFKVTTLRQEREIGGMPKTAPKG
ncbi:MAG TPA: hypothetical protein ENI23_10615 [bacterium]|nr:hypothetical protein [bacterium]